MTLAATDIRAEAGGRLILDGASLSVSPGERVGLIGPNGAGKSSLLRIAAGLAAPTAGRVALDGADLASLAPRVRARRIAYLPQARRVEWPLPARDVVMLGRHPHRSGLARPSPADEAAVARALADTDSAALAQRAATELSEGERTRILLARALAVEAPLLLADEPTAALDPFHQLHVMEILAALAQRGVGVVCVLHDLTLAARYMDRLVLMTQGRTVASGPPADVLTAQRLAEVYGVEARLGEDDGGPFVLPYRRAPDAR